MVALYDSYRYETLKQVHNQFYNITRYSMVPAPLHVDGQQIQPSIARVEEVVGDLVGEVAVDGLAVLHQEALGQGVYAG